MRGSPDFVASYRVLALPGVLHRPFTTQSAYSGKKEQRLETSCFSDFLSPPTSMKVRSLLESSSHVSRGILFLA